MLEADGTVYLKGLRRCRRKYFTENEKCFVKVARGDQHGLKCQDF